MQTEHYSNCITGGGEAEQRAGSQSRTNGVGLYDDFVEGRFVPRPCEWNSVVKRGAVFLFRVVAERLAVNLLMSFYYRNEELFKDAAKDHFKQIRAMLKKVHRAYVAELSPEEVDVYSRLSRRDRETFRICRDLALKAKAIQRGEFFLSCEHLGRRLGVDDMTAHRSLSRLSTPKGAVLERTRAGARRVGGRRSRASEFRYLLSPQE